MNSFQATQFRIWATTILGDFITTGLVLDAERLKQGKQFSVDYFKEMLNGVHVYVFPGLAQDLTRSEPVCPESQRRRL